MQDEIRLIPFELLCEPWIVLRLVNKTSVEYLELRDSIRLNGFFNSICVRPSDRYPGKFEIVDGLHRYAVARELNLSVVPCVVKYGLTDEDVLAMQVQANALRPETTPVEYARQIKKLMVAMSDRLKRPVTMADMSARLHKSPTWISERLCLLELDQKVQKDIERGMITLEAAYALARIPRHLQPQYALVAKTMLSGEFAVLMRSISKKWRENVLQGKLEYKLSEIEPVPYLRNRITILREYKKREVGATQLAAANCTNPLEAWYLALQWVLNLDPAGVERQQAVFSERQKTAILNDACEEEE